MRPSALVRDFIKNNNLGCLLVVCGVFGDSGKVHGEGCSISRSV